MIFQPEIETMGREEMRALQLQRLQQTVRYVYERVPLYRERLDAMKVRPEDIRSLDDVRRLPFTTKEDFRANYPYGLFAVPMKDIVRIHASSGTTWPMVLFFCSRSWLMTRAPSGRKGTL